MKLDEPSVNVVQMRRFLEIYSSKIVGRGTFHNESRIVSNFYLQDFTVKNVGENMTVHLEMTAV